MKKYTIWFEIFGKKMKTSIEANTPMDAQRILRDKIIVHKWEEEQNDFLKGFKDILKDNPFAK